MPEGFFKKGEWQKVAVRDDWIPNLDQLIEEVEGPQGISKMVPDVDDKRFNREQLDKELHKFKIQRFAAMDDFFDRNCTQLCDQVIQKSLNDHKLHNRMMQLLRNIASQRGYTDQKDDPPEFRDEREPSAVKNGETIGEMSTQHENREAERNMPDKTPDPSKPQDNNTPKPKHIGGLGGLFHGDIEFTLEMFKDYQALITMPRVRKAINQVAEEYVDQILSHSQKRLRKTPKFIGEPDPDIHTQLDRNRLIHDQMKPTELRTGRYYRVLTEDTDNASVILPEGSSLPVIDQTLIFDASGSMACDGQFTLFMGISVVMYEAFTKANKTIKELIPSVKLDPLRFSFSVFGSQNPPLVQTNDPQSKRQVQELLARMLQAGASGGTSLAPSLSGVADAIVTIKRAKSISFEKNKLPEFRSVAVLSDLHLHDSPECVDPLAKITALGYDTQFFTFSRKDEGEVPSWCTFSKEKKLPYLIHHIKLPADFYLLNTQTMERTLLGQNTPLPNRLHRITPVAKYQQM
jgi:hypothetical protein